MNDRYSGLATEEKRTNPLTFGATTLAPLWNRDRAGHHLNFDGTDDEAIATLATTISAFPIWLACSFYQSVANAGAGVSIGTSSGTAALAIGGDDTGQGIRGFARIQDGGTGAITVDGEVLNTRPTVVGKLYHAVFIVRGALNQTLFVNGNKSITIQANNNIGTTFTGFSRGAIGLFYRSTKLNFLSGGVYWAALGTIDPGDEFLRALSLNPWPYLYAPRERHLCISLPGGGGAAALQGAAQAQAAAAGALTTAIPLVGAAVAQATAQGVLTTQIPLQGAAAAVTVAQGALTTQITLQGAALAQAAAQGALTTQITLQGAALAQAAAAGDLTAQIRLSGAAIAQAVAQAALTTGIQLAGAAAGQAAAAGALAGGAALQGAAQAVAVAAGDLATGIRLIGAAVAVSTAGGDLVTTIKLSGAAVAQVIASGSLTAQIRLNGAAVAQAIASGELNSPLLTVDPRFLVGGGGRDFSITDARDFRVLH